MVAVAKLPGPEHIRIQKPRPTHSRVLYGGENCLSRHGPPPDARTWIDRLHLFQPAWLMRWWYIVMLVLNIVTIGH